MEHCIHCSFICYRAENDAGLSVVFPFFLCLFCGRICCSFVSYILKAKAVWVTAISCCSYLLLFAVIYKDLHHVQVISKQVLQRLVLTSLLYRYMLKYTTAEMNDGLFDFERTYSGFNLSICSLLVFVILLCGRK